MIPICKLIFKVFGCTAQVSVHRFRLQLAPCHVNPSPTGIQYHSVLCSLCFSLQWISNCFWICLNDDCQLSSLGNTDWPAEVVWSLHWSWCCHRPDEDCAAEIVTLRGSNHLSILADLRCLCLLGVLHRQLAPHRCFSNSLNFTGVVNLALEVLWEPLPMQWKGREVALFPNLCTYMTSDCPYFTFKSFH